MELDPLMLTILGVVAGVLIVIIIVTLAIRIHASRSRSRLRGGNQCRTTSNSGAGANNAGSNKVVVTTIEELDIDHNSSTASLMVLDDQQSVRSSGAMRNSGSASTGLTVAVAGKNANPDLVPFIQQQQSKSTKAYFPKHPKKNQKNHRKKIQWKFWAQLHQCDHGEWDEKIKKLIFNVYSVDVNFVLTYAFQSSDAIIASLAECTCSIAGKMICQP